MGARRTARQLALKVLYTVNLMNIPPDEAKGMIYDSKPTSDTREFADELVDGTLKNLKVIDGLILKYAKNWQMSRIADVDKTIIRMGLYEILYEDSIPPNVSINEAVELAKKFSTSKSHKFVNGILDAAAKNK